MSSSDSTANPWITHGTELRYENPWIRVAESRVTHPSGRDGIYGVVHFKNRAVGVIPIDAEDHTWLVGQFRYALGTYEWEIPAGGCPPGESTQETALRELREETGFHSCRVEPLLENIALSNSVTDERAFIYLARELTAGEAAPEETEVLRLRRLPVDEAIGLVLRGEVTDAMSVLGLLRLATIRLSSGESFA